MKFRSRVYKDVNEEEPNFWPSFVDVMTVVVLVFFFIMVMSFVRSSIQQQYFEDAYEAIDNIAKDREKIYNEIIDKFKGTEAEGNIEIINGTLSVKSETLFDTGSYKLSIQGVSLAKTLGDVFYELLQNEVYKDKIDSIEVIGHTDMVGDGEYNRTLSTNRAISFVNTMVPKESEIENQLGKFIKASGMSKFDPIVGTTETQTEEQKTQNRRIEIKINFNNKDIQDVLDSFNKK
ncbi:OmpA family protein [Oceanirhabdus seepicola]|uniref:OmpA family protein n=1 Tax=Oceanirhabdus seepicola TaxID=2828781 RepID=A0A9J6P055_9CLOT|nr:OmpA family protein [Oceanirhabdus seepicola]MCM1988800.1 OmpA family protein [Oceanirhabdus seepicola]